MVACNLGVINNAQIYIRDPESTKIIIVKKTEQMHHKSLTQACFFSIFAEDQIPEMCPFATFGQT